MDCGTYAGELERARIYPAAYAQISVFADGPLYHAIGRARAVSRLFTARRAATGPPLDRDTTLYRLGSAAARLRSGGPANANRTGYTSRRKFRPVTLCAG